MKIIMLTHGWYEYNATNILAMVGLDNVTLALLGEDSLQIFDRSNYPIIQIETSTKG